MFCISFVVVVVRSRLIGFDRSPSRMAGPRPRRQPFTHLRKITLPLIMPGIVRRPCSRSRFSIDDFGSQLQLGNHVTFPLYIFGAASGGFPVEVKCDRRRCCSPSPS